MQMDLFRQQAKEVTSFHTSCLFAPYSFTYTRNVPKALGARSSQTAWLVQCAHQPLRETLAFLHVIKNEAKSFGACNGCI